MRIALPVSWDQITVGKFQELYPVLTSDMKMIEKVPMLIAVLSDVTVDDVKKTLTISDYKKVGEHLGWLSDFGKLEHDGTTFFIGKQRYSIEFNYKSPADILRNMYGGQYISFMDILKECGGDMYLMVQNMHRLLACVVCKDERKLWGWKKGTYKDDLFEELCSTIKNDMTIDKAYPLTVFFYHLLETLIANISEYGSLQLDQANRVLLQVVKDLRKAGAGM